MVTMHSDAQIPGTKTVEITYTVTGGDPEKLSMTLEVYDGSTLVNTATGLSAGQNQTAARDAGAYRDGQVGDLTFKVVATERAFPCGYVSIEGGTISGTNPLADGELHDDFYPAAYNITVDSFRMDKYLVTKGLWDEVRNDPETEDRGYTDLPAGGGQGVNHPVHTVSWFDAVKWLNARSERAGREPVYYLNAAYTRVFRSGSGGSYGDYLEVYVKATANGYRLPTMDQWEYAARGGLQSKRFPWGDEINHDYANYHAKGSAYSYDTSPYTTSTYHPKGLETGSMPYTTPVDYFPPNDYGLHDMAGNLWQWNYDLHPSYVGLKITARRR